AAFNSAPDARYSSKAVSPAKKRFVPALHDKGCELCQLSWPRACESAQSSRSQTCARISPADRDPSPTRKSLKSAGASLSTFAARYASVAIVCRSGRSGVIAIIQTVIAVDDDHKLT